MKTIYFFIIRLCVVSAFVILPGIRTYGQDLIIKKNGEEIKAKVTEILDLEIKYRKFDNLEGPVYSIRKSEVVLISYANGTREVINSESTPVKPQAKQIQNVNSSITSGQIRRARAGSILNYSLIAPILGFGVAAIAVDDGDISPILGGVATGIGAIFIPIAGAIDGNSMKRAGVRGSPGLRIAGWITYGLFIVDAVTLIAMADEIDDVALSAGPAVLLGVMSTTFMGIDKSMKVQQGKRLQGTASLQPTIGYVRNFTGSKYPTMGIRINF